MSAYTSPHGRRNGRSHPLLNDGAGLVVALRQPANLMERSSDELDGVTVIFGLDAGPGVEAVEARADRQPRNVEVSELVTFVRRFLAADPPDELRASIEFGQRAHREHVLPRSARTPPSAPR